MGKQQHFFGAVDVRFFKVVSLNTGLINFKCYIADSCYRNEVDIIISRTCTGFVLSTLR
jgi:hypothetical protein